MKTILYMAMSVNGMIADENDDAPWSDTIWSSYQAAVEQVGNIIVGRRTYEIMIAGGDFESFSKEPFTVVLSHQNIDGVRTAKSPQEALNLVKNQGFEVALLGGGRQLATEFIRADLVTQINLDVEPLILGGGINLVERVDLQPKLNLIKVEKLSQGVIHLEYEVVKEES